MFGRGIQPRPQQKGFNMRICKDCQFRLGDDVAVCPFCGGKTEPAPAKKKAEPKPEQPFAKCNVCGFKLPADAKKCPFCGGTVAVKAAAKDADKPKTEYQLLQEKAIGMGLSFAPSIGKERLKALIADAEKRLSYYEELDKLGEEELRAAATEVGVELNVDDTKGAIIEKILNAAKEK